MIRREGTVHANLHQLLPAKQSQIGHQINRGVTNNITKQQNVTTIQSNGFTSDQTSQGLHQYHESAKDNIQIIGLPTATGTIGGSSSNSSNNIKHQSSDSVPVIHQLNNGINNIDLSLNHVNGVQTTSCSSTSRSINVNNGSNCVQPSKSSARAAREKALQEIRISLQPFANNDRPTSSASSTSDSSSSPGQTSGIGSSVSSTSNVSSNYSALITPSNGLIADNKELLSRQLFQILIANGYSEESAINALKGCTDRSIESTLDSLPKEYKLEIFKNQSQVNDGISISRGSGFGVTANASSNASSNASLIGQIPLKSLRKSSIGENLISRESAVNGSSCAGSSRSDSPSVSCIANIHRDRLLPDQPRILNSNGLPLNEVHYHSSVHGLPNGHPNGHHNGHHHPHFHHHSAQLAKRNSPNYLTTEPPPPLPPPRGTIVPPPPPPPLSASPTPSSNSSSAHIPVQNTANSVNSSSAFAHQQLQQFMKRMSPAPNTTSNTGLTNGVQVNGRAQAYSYASSASSSSPQRGTSPISFINGHSNGTRNGTNLSVINGLNSFPTQLAQQFQNMGLYPSSNNNNSSNSNTNPNAPQLLPYAQSPVSFNSIFSPPPSYAASSSSGRQSPTPTISSSSDYASVPPQGLNANMQQLHKKLSPVSSTSSASSLTPTSLNSCPSSSSLSKASLVNRPSLQAWTARQAISQSPVIMQSVKSTQVQKPVLQTAIAPTVPPLNSRSGSIPPPVPPPSYPTPSTSNTNQSNMSPQTVTNPPPYPTSVQKTTQPQSFVATQLQECYPANPPPSYASAMQQQQQQQISTESVSAVPQSPPPPPPPLSQPPPPPPPPPYTASVTIPQDSQFISVLSPYSTDFNSSSVQVPTTDPPSYASSVAALAAQRAAVANNNNNGQQMSSSKNTNTVSNSRTNVLPNMPLPTRPAPMPPSNCDLVNTVESICTSQVSALQGVPSSAINTRRQLEVVPPLPPKPNQLNSDVTSVASSSATDFDSDASVSTNSTSNTRQNQKKSHYKTTHQSPIPPRKNLSKEKEKERRESKVKIYSPAAFKFFMEQHVENVIKSHQQRERRRQQLESEMAKVGLSEEAQCQMRRMLHQKESNYIRLRRAKMERSMFKKIKTIGVGAFGEVALVRKIDANQLYAMKTLRKSDVLKRNQVAHVKAERDILAEADNEWVVKLYYSFQDVDHLYFVMDYIPGGDLMSLLIKFGIFQEPLAMFYIAELVLAVESVHKMGFIHRDIKPDNVLIDSDGHIKLTDFGLCTGFRWTHNSKYYQRNNGVEGHDRQDSMDIDESWANNCHCYINNSSKPLERRKRREHQRCLAHSLVGTPNYIAPEVLMRTGYTQLCDWWSVGVILYEMIVGQPPFFANTPEETQNKVIHWDKTLRIPKEADLSSNATDLILKLCCGPDERIGKNGADEIKRHPFFSSIDFEGGLRKQTAPYIPEIKYPTDTSNFDPIDPDKLHSNGSSHSSNGIVSHETYDDYPNATNGQYSENGKHPEHAFFEFTFRRFFDAGGQAYPIKLSDNNNTNNSNDNGQGSPVYV